MKSRDYIIGFILFLIIAILVVLLLFDNSTKVDVNENNNNHSSESNNNNENRSVDRKNNEKRKTLSVVDDYQDFFTINYYINDLYSKLDSNDYDSVIDILEDEFQKVNKVDKANIRNVITSNLDVSYVVKNIYTKGKDNITLYFIDGEEFFSDYINNDGDYNVKSNVYYMLILDEDTNIYNVKPLKVDNLFNYAQDFNLSDKIVVKGNTVLNSNNFTDEVISLTYLSYFKSLLITDSLRAYDLLSDSTKAKYNGYEDFNNKIDEINKTYPSSILNYSAKGEKGKRYYSLVCVNNKIIDFEENGIMDFKVII